MTGGGGGESSVPAGFTYLGQFIDHDLTFDRTKVMLGQNVSPAELLQGRSPSLDLDSLYGAGPQNAGSAKFYTDDRHLKTGKTDAVGDDPRDGRLRPAPGRHRVVTARRKRKALIPDFRNDENLAVAQTHAAFIRFHNRVVDSLPAPSRRLSGSPRPVSWWSSTTSGCSGTTTCRGSARRPWSTTCSPTVGRCSRCTPTRPDVPDDAGGVLHRRVPARPLHDPAGLRLERPVPGRPGNPGLPVHLLRHERGHGGGLRLPSNWIADFRRLYDFGEAGRAGPHRARQPRPTGRCGSTPPWSTRWRTCRPARSAAPRCPTTT